MLPLLSELPHLDSAVCQLVEENVGLASASANGGSVAFFARVAVFGAPLTLTLLNAGRIVPQSTARRSALAPI
jgi:hypothetical protein